jgi:hypothetical protein
VFDGKSVWESDAIDGSIDSDVGGSTTVKLGLMKLLL